MKDQILKYKKFPNYNIKKWIVKDRWGKQSQYVVYYKKECLTNGNPHRTLPEAKIVMNDHKNREDWKKRRAGGVPTGRALSGYSSTVNSLCHRQFAGCHPPPHSER